MIPRCHNRPPFAAGRWHATGRTVQTGTRAHPAAPVVWDGPPKPALRWYPRWFEDRCTLWDDRGFGPDTNQSFAEWQGYECGGCRWRGSDA